MKNARLGSDELQHLLEVAGYGEWVLVDECEIVSPNGHSIEAWDGISPDGEASPLFNVLMNIEQGEVR